jgi:hypothetical protein
VIPRPTPSDSTYLQMIGRGLRPHPTKLDTLILDFAPREARDFVRAQDVLPVPEAVLAQQDEPRDGTGKGVGVLPTGEIVDPAEVRTRLLDYLNLDPLAWHTEGDLSTASVGEKRAVAIWMDGTSCRLYEIMDRDATLVCVMDEWADAVRWARDQMTDEDRRLALKNRRWRHAPVTDKQIYWLRWLGLPYEGLTKGEAAARITHGFAHRAIRRIGGRS